MWGRFQEEPLEAELAAEFDEVRGQEAQVDSPDHLRARGLAMQRTSHAHGGGANFPRKGMRTARMAAAVTALTARPARPLL